MRIERVVSLLWNRNLLLVFLARKNINFFPSLSGAERDPRPPAAEDGHVVRAIVVARDTKLRGTQNEDISM